MMVIKKKLDLLKNWYDEVQKLTLLQQILNYFFLVVYQFYMNGIKNHASEILQTLLTHLKM